MTIMTLLAVLLVGEGGEGGRGEGEGGCKLPAPCPLHSQFDAFVAITPYSENYTLLWKTQIL